MIDLNTVNQNYAIKCVQEKMQKENNTSSANPLLNKKINKKKLLIGTAAAVGIGAIVIGGILYHKKVSSKTIQKLAENIQFQEAGSLADAIKFGQEKLGIKKYKGFQEADLGVVNWINQGLVNVNNVTKGKAIMPKKIVYEITEQAGETITAGTMDVFGTMRISKNNIEQIKETIVEYIRKIAKPSDAERHIRKLEQKNNFKYYQDLLIKIINKLPNEKKTKLVKTHTSTFSIITHELGHLQHMSALRMLPENIDKKFADLFAKHKDIPKKVSKYAETNPTEFVAECFAQLCDEKLTGKKIVDAQTFELYKKLGGMIF